MASKQFFDPIAALRIAPLVTSTCTLLFARDQYLFLTIFRDPSHREKTDAVIPSYLRIFFNRGLPTILSLGGLSISTGLANYLGIHGVSSASGVAPRWYGLGAALAAAHFAFVPAIMYKVKSLLDRADGQSVAVKEGTTAADELKAWLDVHVVRSLLVDLPAWLCFTVAVIKAARFE